MAATALAITRGSSAPGYRTFRPTRAPRTFDPARRAEASSLRNGAGFPADSPPNIKIGNVVERATVSKPAQYGSLSHRLRLLSPSADATPAIRARASRSF